MSSALSQLPMYPVERLKSLVADVALPPGRAVIRFSIGEPRHEPPQVVAHEMAHGDHDFGVYPGVGGSPALRRAVAGWIGRRFAPARVDPDSEVQVVNGTREGLFSLARTVFDSAAPGACVLYPNPGYAVYEGATRLAGMRSCVYDSTTGSRDGEVFRAIDPAVLERTALLFVCSPDNPSGTVQSLEGWRTVFELADRHGFVVATDECYSEIYTHDPPMGALQAAALLGRSYERLVAFSSLSKRSNVPGLRSGFMAGDRELLARAARYRSYNGGGMNPAVDAASAAAWNDEQHVLDSRRLYRQKYEQVIPALQKMLDIETPDAGFFLWADIRRTGLRDTEFARRLYAEQQVLVMPGSYLLSSQGAVAASNRVRIALVATVDECLEGVRRIGAFVAAQAAAAPGRALAA